MTPLEREFTRLKNESLDNDHKPYTKKPRSIAQKRADRVYDRALGVMDSAPDNISETETIRRADKAIDAQQAVKDMVKPYRDYTQKMKEEYYIECMGNLVTAISSSFPDFVDIAYEPSNKELTNLPKSAFGRTFKDYFLDIEHNSGMRLKQLIAQSYSLTSGAKAEERKDLRDAIKGALNNCMNRCDSVYKAIAQVTFELALSRTTRGMSNA